MGKGKKQSNGVVHDKGAVQNGHAAPADPFAVTWADKYSTQLDKVWKRLPPSVGKFLGTLAIMIMGLSIRGEWIFAVVAYLKHTSGNVNETTLDANATFLERYHLQNWQPFVIGASVVSYGMYFGIGGFLHWYFYVRQRDTPHEWKCQPTKWLSPELERHEIMVGSFCLVIGSTLSGLVACYLYNGGRSTMYFGYTEYGLLWWFLQWPVIFIYMDYLIYWTHRIYHTPFLYKNFHKLHHKYKQPTAFSVTAIHPVEFIQLQLTNFTPLLLFPLHYMPYMCILIYVYYHGIIDHSGINFKRLWWQPWQPDCIFHDNHHQYFHVNFAFNIEIWDKIHGTYRQKDRIYREDTYYGVGIDRKKATAAEIKADMDERLAENPKAYLTNKNVYLDDGDATKKKKKK